GQKLSFQVIHLAGEADAEIVKAVYQKIDVPHAVFSYYDQMGDLYGCADLVIARAGAGTVQELLLLNVPVVLVPYPYAGDHQKANASVLTKMGRAVMIEEKHLTADHLKVQVLELADIAKKEGPSEVDWAEAARASQQRLAETVLGVI
ncbi:MAG TPA: glycosyltransferase, partial [Candidatus Omnitrophota bacterium]|nr:glycosyltransferase [Candidatus Omnitrophota bacterium]